MRGIICYYSGSGNTKLACQYLAAHTDVQFDFHHVIAKGEADFASYDIAGFACPADFWGVPDLFQTFVARIPRQNAKPAFVFNTYGALSGKTLPSLAGQVSARGFTVISGHSLHMPESYPPMIAAGRAAENQPDSASMRRFDRFIAELNELLGKAQRDEPLHAQGVPGTFVSRLLPTRPRTTARDDMGEKRVDEELCIECGTCAKLCPYGAVTLDPKPVFDADVCRGCWRCYNQCPQHAIYTGRFRGGPYYPRPSNKTRETLRPR